MALTRRDLIKVGVFAGASLSLPLSRVVSGQSALGNRMPASKLPRRSRHRSCVRRSLCRCAAMTRPTTTDVHGADLRRDHARLPDDVLRLRRDRAGPDDQGQPGTSGGRAPLQHAAVRSPDTRLRAVDLGAPARLGVTAAVRRLCQRHHSPGSVQGLPLSELPAGANALVPRSRRAPHRRERVPRLGRAVPHVRRGRAVVADPSWPVRRAVDHLRRAVQQGRFAVVHPRGRCRVCGAT